MNIWTFNTQHSIDYITGSFQLLCMLLYLSLYSYMDCLFSFYARPYVFTFLCNLHSCNGVRMSHWIKGYKCHISLIVMLLLFCESYWLYSLFIVLYFIGVCMSVHNCGLTVVLLKRHLIWSHHNWYNTVQLSLYKLVENNTNKIRYAEISFHVLLAIITH